MKIFRIIAFLTLCNFYNINAQGLNANDSIEVYLLTASPGEETYAAFGHSAIRVYIPSQNIDIVYNYGTFDFNTPNFYLKFTSGRLMYFLAWTNYNRFVYSYNSWGQALYEQKILLTRTESEKLIHLLNENCSEENRYYRYGFLYDNCATRIRDILEKTVDGKIIYNTSYVQKNSTFRQLVGDYLSKTPWINFGVNILLGPGTDSIASIYNYMFLPEHLRDIFAGAVINNNGITRELTAPPVELFPSTIEFTQLKWYLYPESVFSLVFIIMLVFTFYERKNKLKITWVDRILFIVTGLLGFLIALLWLTSLHKELENNFNILWANPLNFIIGIILFFKKKAVWFTYLLWIYAIGLICFWPLSIFIAQQIPTAAYLIAGIMLIRVLQLLLSKRNG